MNVRDLTMRSPRPSYDRVRGTYDPQGSTLYGRLGALTGGQINHVSYKMYCWKLGATASLFLKHRPANKGCVVVERYVVQCSTFVEQAVCMLGGQSKF